MSDTPRKFFMSPPEGAEPFFEAAKDGKLLIQSCSSCGRKQFYPRKICIHCGSPDVEWLQATGRGTVHTFTVIHQQGMPGWREEVPYVSAIIDLEEGVRMTANVVECAPADVRVEMPVEVTFVDEGHGGGEAGAAMYVLPKFRPAN